jgi:hybrid cluster-associated redox disulfide protein
MIWGQEEQMPEEFSIEETALTVDSVMRRWPATIRVFLDRRMLCVGCPVGSLHTLQDAAAAHDLALADLMTALVAAASDYGP